MNFGSYRPVLPYVTRLKQWPGFDSDPEPFAARSTSPVFAVLLKKKAKMPQKVLWKDKYQKDSDLPGA